MTDIIRADASRIDELEHLWLALREHHGSITPEWGPLRPAADSWQRRRRTYQDILDEGGALFLAVDGEEIVGLIICDQEEGGSPTWQWPQSTLAVVDIIVLGSHRGTGAGLALMQAAEDEARARGVAALDLMSVASNTDARRFYEAFGFRADLITYRKPLT